MKTATSKFVTAFDVIVVVGACSFGVFCGIVGVRYTQQINRKLREVSDEEFDKFVIPLMCLYLPERYFHEVQRIVINDLWHDSI